MYKTYPKKPAIIVLDYHLDGVNKMGMNGIETLDKITSFSTDITVIMSSSQGKIEVAVSCMHHGAFDYVVKSETAFLRLKKTIDTCLRYKKNRKRTKLVYGQRLTGPFAVATCEFCKSHFQLCNTNLSKVRNFVV